MPAQNIARIGIQLAHDLFHKGQLIADEHGATRRVYMIVTLPKEEFVATYGHAAHAGVFIGGTWLLLEVGHRPGVTCLFSHMRLDLKPEENRFGGQQFSLCYLGRKLSVLEVRNGISSLSGTRGWMRLARAATTSLARIGMRAPFRNDLLERPLPPILVIPETRTVSAFDARAVYLN